MVQISFAPHGVRPALLLEEQAIKPLGLSGDCGVLIAGSPQFDFPTATDRLMLGVACNQAAIVLQQQRSEARVRRSEEELADFFDNATVGLHSIGHDGPILRVAVALFAGAPLQSCGLLFRREDFAFLLGIGING